MQGDVFLLFLPVGMPTVLGLEEKEGAEKNLAFTRFPQSLLSFNKMSELARMAHTTWPVLPSPLSSTRRVSFMPPFGVAESHAPRL